VAAAITAPVKNTYGFTITADGLDLAGVTNPVTVTLQPAPISAPPTSRVSSSKGRQRMAFWFSGA